MLTSSPVDFALTEATYTVVRLLHQFPVIRLPASQKVEIIGVEKQTMTLVLSSPEDPKAALVKIALEESRDSSDKMRDNILTTTCKFSCLDYLRVYK